MHLIRSKFGYVINSLSCSHDLSQPASRPAVFWMPFNLIDFIRPLEKDVFWAAVYYIDGFWTACYSGHLWWDRVKVYRRICSSFSSSFFLFFFHVELLQLVARARNILSTWCGRLRWKSFLFFFKT